MELDLKSIVLSRGLGTEDELLLIQGDLLVLDVRQLNGQVDDIPALGPEDNRRETARRERRNESKAKRKKEKGKEKGKSLMAEKKKKNQL